MSNLKYRLATIVALCAISIWALFPRDVDVRLRRPDGTFYDTVQKRIPLKRGLDLSGGMYLALEIDESKQAVTDKTDAIDRALKVVRTRVEGTGVSEPNIQKVGDDRITVELAGIDDQGRAIDIAQGQAFLEFKITDETQALEKVLPRLDQILREREGTAAPATKAPADTRKPVALEGLLTAGDTTKAADSTKRVASADSTRRDSASAADSAALAANGPFSRLIAQGGMPGEYLVEFANARRVEEYLALPEIKAAMPPGKEMLPSNDSLSAGGKVFRPFYVVDARAITTGEYIIDARPAQDPTEGTIVQFTLNNEGGRRFRTETGRHVNDYMAIALDKRVMGKPPVIRSAISTRGQITTGGNLQQAQDLALVLRAGALPVPLKVVEVQTIGPSLGQDSIDKGVRAGLLGLALVVIIMVAYYRFSGLLAVAGLAFYALTTLAFLAMFGATLTLPGIAGFILSIGMAVDANFLQFERIREELQRGKTTRTAIDEGFKNSFSAIIDTHVTTALTGAVLYQYGTGPVQGFAVTLVAGVISSILSSVFVVRTFFLLWLNRSRGAQPLSI